MLRGSTEEKKKIWVCCKDLWIPWGMEEEREDRLFQEVCGKDGDETGRLELEDRKESEDHLTDSLDTVPGRFPKESA